MPTLAARIAVVQAMSTAELVREWERVHRSPAPLIGSTLLCRALTYRLQERAEGGLSATTRKQLRRLVTQLRKGEEIAAEREVVLKTGTRLVREWHGRTRHVMVLDDAFLFEDRRYASLTAIANHITGSRWSGPRFFGLKRRPKAFVAGRVDG